MSNRRVFLSAAGAGVAAWGASRLPLLEAEQPSPRDAAPLVQLRPEIEGLVRLIEETPREKCVDTMRRRLADGVPYREFVAALYLAGIRNVNPQPPGFKFHCVFVIHAAHQISLDAPVHDRLLPMYWALDNFKASQQKDIEEGDFRLTPVRGKLPESNLWPTFHAAMEAWDEERADRAIVALRSRGSHEIIGELWRYGARDYRNIGHKAVFVANTWRTLQTIGWRHAEPALRSLVLGLLDFGKTERVNDYAFEDQCYTSNVGLAARLAKKSALADAAGRTADAGQTLELLGEIRNGRVAEACQWTADRLAAGGASSDAMWDAVHLAAGELMMRQPGIYGIHTVTSSSALRYAFQTAGDESTRILMLLQAVGWMAQFQRFMAGKPKGLRDVEIARLTPTEKAPAELTSFVLERVGKQPEVAARAAMRIADRPAAMHDFLVKARKLIVRKATDAHDYKYPASIFEDLSLVSPQWRPHLLAAATYHLRGSHQPDAPVILRATSPL